LTESIDKAQEKFDIVVDCTGNEEGFDTALHLVRPRSLCVCAHVCVCVCVLGTKSDKNPRHENGNCIN